MARAQDATVRTEPAVSVVVGSNGTPAALEQCLAALEPQLDGAEVIVCEPAPSPGSVRERFPFARFLERRSALVPELWRDGIDASSGAIVALTISPMRPAPDWLATLRARLDRYDAVAGAIDPAADLRASDWAEYFVRYARDMLPFDGHACADLPGDNCAYTRSALERTRALYRDGFWEPEVNGALAAEDAALWHDPELLVRQGRSAGASAFLRQRLAHGRVYGRQRGARFGRGRNAAGALAAPVVPLLLAARTLREVFSKRRFRRQAVAVLPLILAFDVAWAAGEAIGHVDALRRR